MGRMQQALNNIIRWIVEEGINLNSSKPTIVAFTKRTKLQGLGTLKHRGDELQVSREVNYLEVILYPRWT